MNIFSRFRIRSFMVFGSRRRLIETGAGVFGTISCLMVASLFSAGVIHTGAVSNFWVFGINAGGSGYISSNGTAYLADTDFVGGHIKPIPHSISGTSDPALYQDERWGMAGYNIPVPTSNYYTVTLAFVESWVTGPHQRVMNITAEGQSVLSNVDIYRAVGSYHAYNRSFTIRVTDGTLNLGFTSLGNSPEVTGILVTSHNSSPTPSPTYTPTSTPTATPISTPTSTPTATATPTPTFTPTPNPTSTPIPTPKPTPGCTGSPLTSQSQVQPNTSYCGGHATSRIVLASGDTWTNGEVSGVSTGQQQGAVGCDNSCTLVNMNIHDNPGAFGGIYLPGDGPGPYLISGGRITNNGSLGVGGSNAAQLTISGVELDHNGANAGAYGGCGFEGGGFKGVNHGARLTNNYVHDNYCPGIWFDIDAANNEIDHNHIVNNVGDGIFYEISHDASIHDNVVTGNGYENGTGCAWLWGAGIGIASSYNVQVYNNTLVNNCNGIGETQQNRGTGRILQNNNVHNNSITGGGQTGIVQDDGDQGVFTRNNTFTNNTYHEANCSATHWAWQNASRSFIAWQGYGLDSGGVCGT